MQSLIKSYLEGKALACNGSQDGSVIHPLPVSSTSWKGFFFFFFEQFPGTVKIARILTNICTYWLPSSGIDLQVGCTGKFPYLPCFSSRYLFILHLRQIREIRCYWFLLSRSLTQKC